MTTRIDLLLNEPTSNATRIIGKVERNAPYVHLFSGDDNVLLPMPNTVSSRNQIIWDQKDFTADSIRGAATLGAMNKSSLSAGEIVKAGGGAFIEGMMKDAISGVGSAVGGIDGLGDYRLHKKGKAVNPNKEMTFNGIAYRTFTLEFEFIPLNSKEAQSLQEFIKFFQTKAMPDFAGELNTYLSYPDQWSIKFAKANWLPVILPCYLTDYSIAYGGAGKMVAHVDSSVQTNISLTFTESELHTKSRVLAGAIG